MDSALCAQIGPADDLWFPEKGSPGQRARTLCARCSVREECEAYASADTSLRGMWGGRSHRDRQELRRVAGDAA